MNLKIKNLIKNFRKIKIEIYIKIYIQCFAYSRTGISWPQKSVCMYVCARCIPISTNAVWRWPTRQLRSVHNGCARVQRCVFVCVCSVYPLIGLTCWSAAATTTATIRSTQRWRIGAVEQVTSSEKCCSKKYVCI